MRPQGVIRVALREAATRLANERGGASWREIASAATVRVEAASSVGGEIVQRGVSPGRARQTIKDMVRAGELQAVGRQKPAGSSHYCEIYAPTQAQINTPSSEMALHALGVLVTGWARHSV